MSTSKNLPLPNEDELNLELCVVSQNDGNAEINLLGTNALLNDETFDSVLGTIPETEIDRLYEEVKEFTTSAKECVTALQIFYGAVDNDGTYSLFPIFQSVFLSFDHYDDESETYIYMPTEYGNLYSWDGSAFVASSAAELATVQSDFKAKMSFIHNPGASFAPFIEGTDAEGVTFPFQEIYAVLHDNMSSDVTFHYCMDTIQDVATNCYKMNLLLSAVMNGEEGQFAGVYANRGNTCPPLLSLGIGYNL